MSRSASFKRAGLVFSAIVLMNALSSCAPGLDTQSSESTAASSVDAATAPVQPIDQALGTFDLVDAAPAAGQPASSRVLMDSTKASFGLELIDGSDFNQLLILSAGGKGAPAYNVSRLQNPDRVIIDLKNERTKGSRIFDTADSQLLERVRIGAHPDKSRIVLDLPADAQVSHDVQTAGTQIVVTLSKPGTAIDTSQAALAPKTELALAEKPTEAPALKTDIAEPVNEVPAEKAQALALAQITGIELQPVGSNENMLLVQGSSALKPEFKQTAPSEYTLTINGVRLSENADSTLLAPPASGAIRSVRPIAEDEKVTLRIFASPEKKLALRSAGGTIVVSTESASDEAQMRAQLTPEKPAEPSPAAKAPAKAEATPTTAAPVPAAPVEDAEVSALLQETPKYTGRLISLDLQDTDIDNALRIIAEVSNLNIIASEDVAGKVTLRLIDVPWDQALDVILKTNGLDKVQEGNVIRIAPVEKLRQEREALKQAQQAEQELEPLQVRYIRVSYAKASELKPLVESVLSERGTVNYDERTNQLIIKDIRSGLKNVAELVAKIDLRTPQVLLETQIVEANRTLLRDLGAELGFTFVRSPATGNATGWNFPNSINIAGSATGAAAGTVANFPASGESGITFLLDSADGTRSLSARISALENEGRVRVVSRPAVATTNNKAATIKSVEKIRIKVPSGGLSVATGQGASASGSSTTATETVEIGIVLEVTPQASPDYFVLLDINAKSSTLGSTFVDGIPSEIERSATSSVLVSSGQTFAMGGIYKISEGDRVRGVPFFKDIPFLGHLFREMRTDNADEELLFFLTPRIIEGSFDDAAMRASL